MKILCCADLHNHSDKFDLILRNCTDYDYIVLNGDITNFGSIENFRNIYNKLNPDKTFINWGNCDSPHVIEEIQNKKNCLHAKGFILPGSETGIFGLSGSNTTPFRTYGEYSEQDRYHDLTEGYKFISDCRTKILFTHAPPYKTKTDRTFMGIHAGCRAIRKFLEEYPIDLVICSHIHESYGQDALHTANIYNTGAVKNKRYGIIFIHDNNIKVELLTV